MVSLSDIIHAPLEELFAEAARLRRSEVDLCAIVNIKNGRCAMDCRFCAQSKHHQTDIETYPLLSADDLAERTQSLWRQEIPKVGWVASGCSPSAEELDMIIAAAETIIPAAPSGCFCCASLGQLEAGSLRRLKDAGFCRYHHNLETSERYYPAVCSTQRYRDRRATVERVKTLGWTVCSGGLFGIGETWQDRWDLAVTLQALEVDSVPINFFNAAAGTPFANIPPLTQDEALRITALFRFVLPKAAIRICGGRPKIFPPTENNPHGGAAALFYAGADALMTGNYLTTSGITPELDKKMIQMVQCGNSGV